MNKKLKKFIEVQYEKLKYSRVSDDRKNGRIDILNLLEGYFK